MAGAVFMMARALSKRVASLEFSGGNVVAKIQEWPNGIDLQSFGHLYTLQISAVQWVV